MLSMLVFYDRDGNVIGTLDYMVARDEEENVVGLVDFEAHELAGGRMRDIADASTVTAPDDVARDFLGRDPEPGERPTLPPDHPYRVANERIVGAGTWPEWLGGQAHDFKVELDENPGQARTRVKALVHRKSRVKRKREDVEKAIAARVKAANGAPADLRDLLGGPDRPLRLDETGRTMERRAAGPAVELPFVAAQKGRPDEASPAPSPSLPSEASRD